MPELPDITVYVERLTSLVGSAVLEQVRLKSPFLLRSFNPPISAVNGKAVRGVRRLGKRIVFELEGDLFLVLHLMISGRLHWKKAGAALGGRISLAAFDFAAGSLVLTEASSRKRASLYVVQGEGELDLHDRGGLEPLGSSYAQFKEKLLLENRTLKRALTSPHLFSGIGNAYSDEILHAAGLSPVTLTSRLSPAEIKKLHRATQTTLRRWIDVLRAESKDSFPEKVTAFRPDMAVHGKYRQPCPTCGTTVQRIRYAENEVNYCPRCQTQGRMLADRSLSRLLGSDWPKTVEDWEDEHPQRRDGTPG
jgi:formamidopyrimidine-DNA glycosylase